MTEPVIPDPDAPQDVGPSGQRSVGASAWRFLIVGGTNTLITTALLVVLSYLMPGWLAYTIVFAAGLIFNSIMASRWVFTREGSWKATALYAGSYLVIYVVGLGVVQLMHLLGWPHWTNALSVVATAPLGFVAGRLVFRERRREENV
ncbi:hypothetical protein GCM10027515_01290 [Schumannella luteola]|uniref:Putative flippase GtrA n=1 Tax=Schumannella luteola TaxID=472059 RepID=A0A852YC23_9MICO|nr:putative flippase GtrA [Schumannella luteola]